MMTASTFIGIAEQIQANYKTVYLWGGWGQKITSEVLTKKYEQYSSWYTNEKKYGTYNPLIDQGYYGFDCVGLIKAIAWGWCGKDTINGGASYGSNGCKDTTANGMINLCSNVSNNFTSIVPGEAVWMDGHIGIYVGNGYCIESTNGLGGATPGVKVSALANIGTQATGTIKSRTWTKHGRLPFIDYSGIVTSIPSFSSNANASYADGTSSTQLATGSSFVASTNYTFEYDTYETVSNFGTQPFHAFVDLWIGDTHVPQIPPNYMMSCDVTQLSGSADSDTTVSNLSGNIVLFDKYCDEVEYLLAKNPDNCILRIGDALGRQSSSYKILIESYNIRLTPSGNILTLKFVSSAAADANTLLTMTAGSSPSAAVRSIANKMGWKIGRIDEAQQLKGGGGETVTFNLANDNPSEYIKYKIAPRAIRKEDGKGGYQFYLDSTTTPATVYFHPVDLASGGLRTYVYQKGKNSPILDFSISSTIYPGAEGSVATEYRAAGIDPLTKGSFNITAPYSENVQDVSGTNKTTLTNTNPALVNTSGLSADEISASVAYRYSSSNIGEEGTLTIIGDPSIAILDNVRIIILNNDNTMHHLSGIYQVNGINHHISTGTMTTTLSVVKASTMPEAQVTLKSASVKK